MRIRPIFTFFFSFFVLLIHGQTEKDSLKAVNRYKPNFLIGADLLNSGISLFSDRKVFTVSVSSRIKNNIHAVAIGGYEKNLYQKNGYDASAGGVFVKLGADYMLVRDRENIMNGFYGGGTVAASFYSQEYRAVPVRGFAGNTTAQAFPISNQSSYWVEADIGGRVQLFESPFFLDTALHPKYLLFTTKQDGIFPMIVPGFGKSSTKFNVGFSWSLLFYF